MYGLVYACSVLQWTATRKRTPPELAPPVRFSLTTNGPPVRYCALPSKMAALDTHSDRFPTTFHFWLLSAQLRFSNVCYTASWCLIFTTDHFCTPFSHIPTPFMILCCITSWCLILTTDHFWTPFSHIPTHLHESLLYNLRNFLSYLAIVCYTVI